jgi:hypothetical protein
VSFACLSLSLHLPKALMKAVRWLFFVILSSVIILRYKIKFKIFNVTLNYVTSAYLALRCHTFLRGGISRLQEQLCVNSGFRRDVIEIRPLLWYYAMLSDHSLPTFRFHIQGSRNQDDFLKMGPIDFPETSVSADLRNRLASLLVRSLSVLNMNLTIAFPRRIGEPQSCVCL